MSPENPHDAKRIRVDREVKLHAAGQPKVLRALAAAFQAGKAGCGHPIGRDAECGVCQTITWTNELLRAMATEIETPHEPEKLSPEKLSKVWLALVGTFEKFPRDTAKLADRVRTVLHPDCRIANDRHDDGRTCGMCQLASCLAGALAVTARGKL